MVTPDLTKTRASGERRWRHDTLEVILRAGVGVALLTVAGCLLGIVAPGLAGNTAPHPTLTGSLQNAVSILVNNLRVLAAPFGLAALGLQRSRIGRRAGDLALTALTATSTMTVGLALGRWRGRLLPFIPQLPIEWAALAVALSAWLLARNAGECRPQLGLLAALAGVLLIAAAGIETWCTPHRPSGLAASRPVSHARRDPVSTVGVSGCARLGLCAAGGHIASRSQAPFPSLRSVPLGRPGGADRAHPNHRPPQGGITT